MFADIKSTKHIIQFLLDMEVGNRTTKKEKEQKDEGRDKVNGWDELMETPPEHEEEEEEEEDENEERRREEEMQEIQAYLQRILDDMQVPQIT
jgi:predicted RNA-binding protein Jag